MLLFSVPSMLPGAALLPEWRKKKGYIWLGALPDGSPLPRRRYPVCSGL